MGTTNHILFRHSLILVFSALFASFGDVNVSAQILVGRTPSMTSNSLPVEPYDSLENLSRITAKKLVGQMLFLRPYDEASRIGFYRGLNLYTRKVTSRQLERDFYKPFSNVHGNDFPSYHETCGKFFLVTEFTPGKVKTDDYWLQLVEQESGDTVYLAVSSSNPSNDFIVVGFFEKKKQNYVGKKFIARWDDSEAEHLFGITGYQGVRDSTGRRIQIRGGSIVTCNNIFVPENKSTMGFTLVVSNDSIGQCFMEEKDLSHLFDDYAVIRKTLQQSAENKKTMIAKYGKVNGTLVASGKVKIGFTKAMCKDAWGEPDAIHKTTLSHSTTEQWVYGLDSYLYFTDGRLTAIQN